MKITLMKVVFLILFIIGLALITTFQVIIILDNANADSTITTTQPASRPVRPYTKIGISIQCSNCRREVGHYGEPLTKMLTDDEVVKMYHEITKTTKALGWRVLQGHYVCNRCVDARIKR